MKQNLYHFRVSYYPRSEHIDGWYPPIQAQTYAQAITKLYRDEHIESANLKFIVLPDDRQVYGRDLHNPTNYDIRENEPEESKAHNFRPQDIRVIR